MVCYIIAISCHAMPCRVVSCRVMSRHVVSFHVCVCAMWAVLLCAESVYVELCMYGSYRCILVVYVCTYVRMYACMYVCVCVCLCMVVSYLCMRQPSTVRGAIAHPRSGQCFLRQSIPFTVQMWLEPKASQRKPTELLLGGHVKPCMRMSAVASCSLQSHK